VNRTSYGFGIPKTLQIFAARPLQRDRLSDAEFGKNLANLVAGVSPEHHRKFWTPLF